MIRCGPPAYGCHAMATAHRNRPSSGDNGFSGGAGVLAGTASEASVRAGRERGRRLDGGGAPARTPVPPLRHPSVTKPLSPARIVSRCRRRGRGPVHLWHVRALLHGDPYRARVTPRASPSHARGWLLGRLSHVRATLRGSTSR